MTASLTMSRSPLNFDKAHSRQPGAAYVPDLVKQWLKENRVAQRLATESLFARWREVVGDEISSHTRVVDVVRGELLVEVDSAPLLNELATYYSQEILASVKGFQEFRGVSGIRFRSGSF